MSDHILPPAAPSGCSSQPIEPNEIYLIYLNGMCFFCLNEQIDFSLSDDDDDDKLRRFQQCWAYIKPKGWNAPNAVFVVRGEENVDGEDTTTEICSKIPPICTACSFDLDRIVQCHEEILELQRRQEAVKSKLSCTLKTVQEKMSSSATALSQKTKSKELQKDTVNYIKGLLMCLPNFVDDASSSQKEDKPKVKTKIEIEEDSNSTISSVSSDSSSYHEDAEAPDSDSESKCVTFVQTRIAGGSRNQDPLEPAPAIKSSCGRYMVRSDNPKFYLQSQLISNVRERENNHNRSKRAHVQQEKPYFHYVNKCEICGKVIPLSKMYDHMYKHVGNLAYRCPVANCGQTFASRYSFYCTRRRIMHRLGCPVDKKCDTCGKDFEKLVLLGNHLKGEHETLEKNFNCPITGCEESFTVKQSLEYHMRSHFHQLEKTKLMQNCSICKEKEEKQTVHNFAPEKLEIHLKEFHNINEVIKCKRCTFLFSDKEEFVDHVGTHLREGGVTCDMCSSEEIFLQGNSLRRHYFKEHQIGRQYLCEQCDLTCFHLASLRKHLRVKHKGTPRKKFSCVVCEPEVVFKESTALEAHNIRLHGAPELKCKSCEKTFTSRAKLARHKKYDHLGVKRPTFTCATYGEIFQDKLNLKKHSKQHSSERTFNCTECEKTFKTGSGLKYHVNVEHRGMRYVCEICGKGFRASTVLTQHKRIHTGERPFMCGLCGHQFRFKSALYNHTRGHRRKGDRFAPKKTFDRTPK